MGLEHGRRGALAAAEKGVAAGTLLQALIAFFGRMS
jgi:hypothetical protein